MSYVWWFLDSWFRIWELDLCYGEASRKSVRAQGIDVARLRRWSYLPCMAVLRRIWNCTWEGIGRSATGQRNYSSFFLEEIFNPKTCKSNVINIQLFKIMISLILVNDTSGEVKMEVIFLVKVVKIWFF